MNIDDWEQVPCKACSGSGWILKWPHYDDGPRCHKCGGHGRLIIMKDSPIMDLVKQFAADVLKQWPSISGVVVGGLTSIVTKDWSPFLSALGGVLVGKVGGPPVAKIQARLRKKQS